MPDTIPNLWPKEIKIDVQTPYTILKVQAGLLGKVTRGILEGAVETETAQDKVQHRLVIVAPAYHSYRHTLVAALHHPDLPYPAEVRAEALAKRERVQREGTLRVMEPAVYTTVYPSAYDDNQMLKLVQEALQSAPTTAAILSLIAKSNEVKHGGPPNGGALAEPAVEDTQAGQAPQTPAGEDGGTGDDIGR